MSCLEADSLPMSHLASPRESIEYGYNTASHGKKMNLNVARLKEILLGMKWKMRIGCS